jgi:DNA-binding MarR family transcriptional regulator
MIAPEELAALVADFGKSYTRRIWSEMERAGTTPARARLLMALQCRGSCKMSEIGAQLEVTPRSVTKLVDSLESEGLVVREQHPQDRRATLLTLTAAGMLVCKESALANHAAIAKLYEQLSGPDRAHLARILRKLLTSLDDASPAAKRRKQKA